MIDAGHVNDDVSVSLTALRVRDLAVAQHFWVNGCGLITRHSISTEKFDALIVGGKNEGSGSVELVCEKDGKSLESGTAFWKLALSSPDVVNRMQMAVNCGGVEVTAARAHQHLGGLVLGMIRCPDGYLVEFVQSRSTSEDRFNEEQE